MKSKIALTIALITLAAFGVSSAQAHKGHYNNNDYYSNNNGNDYQNNGNDYSYSPTYNHYTPWHHRHVDDMAQQLRDFATRDVAISAPIDNSGDVKANTDSVGKNNCEDSTCTVNNVNVIGNGNTVVVNNNQDGGSGY